MIARLIKSGVMDNPSFVPEKQNQACENVPMIKVGNQPLRHPGICAANFRGPATKEKGIDRYHPSIFIHESTIIIRGRFSHRPQSYHRMEMVWVAVHFA